MKGDFTRNTFDARKHFVRVLMQQGRVQLDADWNEQADIGHHYLRSLAADLIGPYGGPGEGFRIGMDADALGLSREEWKKLEEQEPLDGPDFYIRPGHYYVAGLLCENDGWARYRRQPDPFLDAEEELDDGKYLVYLDVWEQHITYLQDDSIREVALGGPDTATRSRLVWQVKTWPAPGEARRDIPSDLACEKVHEAWAAWGEKLQPANRGRLGARAGDDSGTGATEACITPPGAHYRGAENQLYRVEIHHGGKAGKASLKWSRDNGSVAFAIRDLDRNTRAKTTTVTLEHLGHDDRFSLQEGDWVEVVDDDDVLRGRPGPLFEVTYVDRLDLTVQLDGLVKGGADSEKHPLLRRWDQKPPGSGGAGPDLSNGLPLDEGKWLELEDGIQIWFDEGSNYRSGDYWLIPARTATGDVEWPQEEYEPGKFRPQLLPPRGVEHHYAPLAIVGVGEDPCCVDCRYRFEPLAKPV